MGGDEEERWAQHKVQVTHKMVVPLIDSAFLIPAGIRRFKSLGKHLHKPLRCAPPDRKLHGGYNNALRSCAEC